MAGKWECGSCVKQKTLLFGSTSHIFPLAASVTQEEGTSHVETFLSLLLSNRWVTSGRGYHQFILDRLCPEHNVFYRWSVICSVKSTKEGSLISLHQEMWHYWKPWVWFSSLSHALGPSLLPTTCIRGQVPPGRNAKLNQGCKLQNLGNISEWKEKVYNDSEWWDWWDLLSFEPSVAR